MKRNALNWIAASACTACGIGLCLSVARYRELFLGVHFPFTTRTILFIGPIGWLVLSLATSLLIIRYRQSLLGTIFAIAFLLAIIALGCALLFSNINCSWNAVS